MDRDQQSDFSEPSEAWEILTRQELGVNVSDQEIETTKSDETENGKFTMTVNKQDFIEAILEWERQEEIQASMLLAYATQPEGESAFAFGASGHGETALVSALSLRC